MMAEQIRKKLNEFKPLKSVLDYGLFSILLHHPYKLGYYYFYKKFVYKKTQKGVIKKVNTCLGSQMHIMLPASLDIFFFGLKSHPSEISLAKYILNTLKEGDCFIDIGAHFGYYTILASQIVGKAGKVISIEASPETIKILRLNTAHLQNVEVKNMAISDIDDNSIKFCVFPVYYSELNTLNPSQYENLAWYSKIKSNMVEVPASTLSSLVERNNLTPKIIKIDVEGAEGLVMRGATKKLSALKGVAVIIEYVNDSKDPAPYVEAEVFLNKINYLPYFIQADGTLRPIQGSILDFMKVNKHVSENIVFLKSSL